jgi:hypothetical protein
MFLYPVSANPLHSGHLSVAQYIFETYDTDVLFEICNETYDKDKIDDNEIARRLKQFSLIGRECIVSDRTSFVEKAIYYKSFFEKTVCYKSSNNFVVGYDTIKRIDDPKYYYGSEVEKNRCLKIINDLGWTFHVFPRDGKIDENLSTNITDMCIFHTDFKEVNINSTALRQLDKNNYKNFFCLKDINDGEYFLYNNEIYQRKCATNETATVQYGEEFIILDLYTTIATKD